jgi:hypothetical protein
VTPIDTGTYQVSNDPVLRSGTAPSYALLATDGQQAGCTMTDGGGNAGTLALIDSMRRAGIRTFVLGFGSAGGSTFNATVMNEFADAGGMPNTSVLGQLYYSAQDPGSIQAVLDTIARQTWTCSYTLTQSPPNPSLIYVFFNKLPVPNDPSNGWQYNAGSNQVQFFGTACAELLAPDSGITNMEIVYGCPIPT